MFRPLSTSAIALILTAAPGLADVTPAQVWENLRASFQDMGYQVQVGSEDNSGQRLTLNEVTLSSTDTDAADMTLTMPAIVLEPADAGSVRSVIEGQMLLTMRNQETEGEDVGFRMTLDAPGNETISSGTPEAMDHRYVVPSLTAEGRALDDQNEVPVTLALTDAQGSQQVRRAQDGSSQQVNDLRVAGMEMSITGTGPSPVEGAEDATDRFSARFSFQDLALAGTGAFPGRDIDFNTDPEAALQAGMAGDGTFRSGPLKGTFEAATTDAEGQVQNSSGSVEAASGQLAVSMSAEGLTYRGSATDMQTRITSSEMPFPIAYAAKENTFNLTVPVVASPEQQPFALSYGLTGLTIDEAIWQALDPQGTLPRDPANLMIDLEGQAVVTQSFLDPNFAPSKEATEGEEAPPMPFLPRSLAIKDISVDAAGSSAQFAGDLEFGDDPSQPVGTITGRFAGVNGLMDNLVAMGVVPQEQLMGVRMMMAMFARPVEGETDRLQTELEFREGGSIFANGQQVR
ncbi:DUF2125 domain-containing protein [Paracoccus sp. (in: a-proteobacteria)]|uniref:DUF2125 domain-containing protein n=1 Tax=Paracoccus sp. TaxID=267 RepID=UPI00396CACE7